MTSSTEIPRGVDRDELVRYLDGYLEVEAISDYGPNGLQVEGRSRIRRVVGGVSACVELFRAARRSKADAVLVHHGLFWGTAPLPLVGVQLRRVAELIRGELSLLAYHLPLDRHPEVGNNAVAARALGLVDCAPFGRHRGITIGWKGRFHEPLPAKSVMRQIAALYGQSPLTFAWGPEEVSSVALVSGSGGRCLYEAIQQSLDLFVTGEADEWSMHLAREAGIHFVAAGHHATERAGVEALCAHLEERFPLTADFVNLPNPV